MPLPSICRARKPSRARFCQIFIAGGLLITASWLPASAVTPEVGSPPCELPTEATARELSELFNAELRTRHPDHVARLYADDSRFQGFASPAVRADYAAIRAYYLYFLQFEPQMTSQRRAITTGCNTLIDVGNSTWSLKKKDATKAETLSVSYRLAYEFKLGKWLITEQIERLLLPLTAAAKYAVPDPTLPQQKLTQAPMAPAVAGFLMRRPDVKSHAGTGSRLHQRETRQKLLEPNPDDPQSWWRDVLNR